MGKENKKSEGDLLYVGPAFVPAMRFKGKMYVEIRDFECCVRDIQRELENLSELNRKQSKAFGETMKDYRGLLRDYMKLEEENKKLKEDYKVLGILNDEIRRVNENLREDNKNLKDKIEHLEFDIEAWKKLKAVWEKKEQKLQIEIGGLMGERDGLKMVVERLHKEIEEQEAEGGGLFDEIDYRKREAKRLGWKPNN